MFQEKELDITIRINDGPEVPVHLSGPGYLLKCSQAMRTGSAPNAPIVYSDEMRLTVGIFNCTHVREHDASYGNSVAVILDHDDVYKTGKAYRAQFLYDLGEDFDPGNWDFIEFEIPLHQFGQYSIEPKIERPPLRVRLRRVGALIVRKYEVKGTRRHRRLVPVEG